MLALTFALIHSFICLTGFKIDSMQKDVVELRYTYDGPEVYNQACGIGDNYNKNQSCLLQFIAPKTMMPPILVHYEVTNFHQNHRTYFQSRDDQQLAGYIGPQDPMKRTLCRPLNKLGNTTLHPCGLIANTFFNDYFTLVEGIDIYGTPLRLIETGIAWQSDLKYMFKQPEGFKYEECSACDDTCCTGEWECGSKGKPYVDKDGTCYRFVYPNDKTTQYIYETYPDIISPIEGVTNEHFVVWMRVATQPTFRKLYGWINQPIIKGQRVTFRVNANFAVNRFKGSKSLLISTNNIFGGRNPFLGPLFYWTGGFFLVCGTFFGLKQIFRPRRLADPAYLHYKDE
jgi:LEM3 (ligand-effect modulator 3) family / CDC50 family